MNRNFTAICATLLMCAILFVFFGSSTLGKSALCIADTQEKVVYLTFDDGPSDRVTPKILDVLKEENVKATFFIVGERAETRKYLVEREIAEGHTVGVHSYTHRYSEIYSCADKLIKDIDKCNAMLELITGKKTTLYRFPGGSDWVSDALVKAVAAHGMHCVDWNASTRDAEFVNPSPELLYKSAIRTAEGKNRVVMLAHDTTDKVATPAAIKKIIGYFKSRNYAFAAF